MRPSDEATRIAEPRHGSQAVDAAATSLPEIERADATADPTASQTANLAPHAASPSPQTEAGVDGASGAAEPSAAFKRRQSRVSLTRRLFIAGGVGALAGSVLVDQLVAAPEPRLVDPHWSQTGHDALGPSHELWSDFLYWHRKVGEDGVARIDYAAALEMRRTQIDGYLGMLQGARPSEMTQDAAFAFWCNLFNASTVALVLDAFPVNSIRDVRGGLLRRGPWEEQVLEVEGRPLSLNDILHGILRPIYRDARVNYVLSNAALGGPDIPPQAIAAGPSDLLLEPAARAFVNHPRGVRVEGDRAIVSSLFEWRRADFGGDDDERLLAHLKRYAEPRLQRALDGVAQVERQSFDWRLNAASA